MNWISWIPLLGLAPILIMVGLLYWQNHRLDADERREAITTELRNPPAGSLQTQRDDLLERQFSRLFAAIVIGLSTVGIFSTRRAAKLPLDWDWLDSVALLVLIGCGIYYGVLMIREMPQSRKLRQAIRAEQATAQEIGSALSGDNRIIHDVQAGEFNIDHVAITPAGVFAVETKSRLKPPAGQGADAVRVHYDGKVLKFPSWTESEPIEQAARQAKWLANYLKESTGKGYPVIPVLSLPGWFVVDPEHPREQGVRVINPKNARYVLLPNRPSRLPPEAIQAAAFQIQKLALVAKPD